MFRFLSLLLVLASLVGVECRAQALAVAVAPETIVQRQVEAYNARDVDRFASFYADKVQLITMATGETDSGIEKLRQTYGAMFKQYPKLKCTVVARIVQGEFVIDKEVVEGVSASPIFATAIYQVKDGKIVKVWFL